MFRARRSFAKQRTSIIECLLSGWDHYTQGCNIYCPFAFITHHSSLIIHHSLLQLLPQPGNGNIQLLAVLGDCSAGNVVAFLLQQFSKTLITEGLFLVLELNQVT